MKLYFDCTKAVIVLGFPIGAFFFPWVRDNLIIVASALFLLQFGGLYVIHWSKARLKRRPVSPRPLEPHFLKLLRFFLTPERRIELDLIINDIRAVAQEMKVAKYPRRTIRLAIAWHTLRSVTAILYDAFLTLLSKLHPAAFLHKINSSAPPPPPVEAKED